jgi:hypothetical protein
MRVSKLRASRKPFKRTNKKKTIKRTFKANQNTIINPKNTIIKPQVFIKTLLSTQNPGSQTIVGANLPYASISGVTLGSMPDISNIVALYNRYKFLAVTYTFNCQPVDSFGLPLANFDLPKIYLRYNYDSNLTSGSMLAKMQEIPNVKQFQFTPEKTQVQYTFYPRTVEPVYLSSIASGFKLSKPQYIDCQYSSVPHYGIMIYMDRIASGVQVQLDISYKVAFKYSN